jgi:magnesium-protoporphyrin IX monomethyl ester (oxidative) cyclase
MEIVLVHPAGSNWIPGCRDVSAVANRMAPLGLLSIAAYLERAGHAVRVHDCLGPFAPAGAAANAAAVAAMRPDLVGFSTTTAGFLDAVDMAAAIKALRPGVTTICGGVHASGVGPPLLQRFTPIDCLAIGEGEQTLAELAAGVAPEKIRGLVWRSGAAPQRNPPREPIADLDALPLPAYEKLAGFPRRYALPLFSYIRPPGATVVTSRGCPYRCSYCDRSVFRRSYRANSAAYVYRHLCHLRERFGVRHVNIYDDLFTLDRGRVEELCRLLAERPLGLQLNCAVRVGHCDARLLALLKRAGFLMLSLGIETGDPSLLRRHKPGAGLAAIRSTVARIQSAGLRAKGLFMMGLPGDSEASIAATSELCLSLDLDEMNMAKFTPFPGAPIWSQLEGEGRFDEDWRRMNCLNFVFVPRAIASRERLEALYAAHVRRYYASRGWRRRFRRHLWQHRYSLLRLLRHLPSFLAARRSFSPAEGRKPV